MLQICKMMTLGVKECDKLDGAFNFISWKLKLQMLMEEAKVSEHVEKVISTPTNPMKSVIHHKEEAKAKQIIHYSEQDHPSQRGGQGKANHSLFRVGSLHPSHYKEEDQ
jgi:hypothetical protein